MEAVLEITQGREVALRMFHASQFDIQFPNFQKIIQNRTNHANGSLGLWVSRNSEWFTGDRNHLYEVEFTARPVQVTVSRLKAWNIEAGTEARQVAYHLYQREKLMALGYDYIELLELGGRSEMGVIMNLQCITSWRKIR